MAHAEDALAKYDPNEPRDERGRWTTGGGTAAAASSNAGRRRMPIPDGPVGRRRGAPILSAPAASDGRQVQSEAEASRPDRSWGGPVHLEGGQIVHTAGPGSNGPPEDPREELIPEPVPDFNAPKVPQGWDIPGHTAGGLQYPARRRPTLPDGSAWPEATPDYILALLRGRPDKTPVLFIFVPRDGVGPVLSGATPELDLPRPEGYDEVRLIGRPQLTNADKEETLHARESVVEGLRLAESNEFSVIFFNRALATVAREVAPPNEMFVESTRRPDISAIVRPSIELHYRIVPFEILSPGQTITQRRLEIPEMPGVKLIEGRYYKRSMILTPGWFRRLEVRPLCL